MVDFEQNDEQNNSKYARFITSDADLPEPPAELHGKIMRRVVRAKQRILFVKTIGFGALLVGSTALVIAGYLNLMSAFAQSGFLDFTSLFFSDFGAATANFQDFIFSTLESFPVFSAAFLVGGMIALIWSAAHFIDDILQMRAQRNGSSESLALG